MFVPRVIPCLLIHKGGLVKTVRFKNPKYIGDPINTVKIFNEKEVDELIIMDIDATPANREPDYSSIEDIVSEAFMPVCYGGGITCIEQMQRIFWTGVEKVSLSASAINNHALVKEAAGHFGSQSIVVTLDITKTFLKREYQVVTHNATKKIGLNPLETAVLMEKSGAGELVISNVDRDGLMTGYDVDIIKKIAGAVDIPTIALGGAGTLDHLKEVVTEGGAFAAAAGSMFVYHGKHRAVLVNYPKLKQIMELFEVNANEYAISDV